MTGVEDMDEFNPAKIAKVNLSPGQWTAILAGTPTSSLKDIEKKDSLIVQAAVRNAVSLAVKHLAGRDPTTATHADMNFENVVWEMMQKEFTKGPDYSGGKA